VVTTNTPREQRHQRTRDAILDAARRILHEEGVEGLSMRAIAQRIEYSPAGLYEYFDSKEAIIGAVCQQGFVRLDRQLGTVDPALPALEMLAASCRNYLRFAADNPDFYMLMFTNAPLTGITAVSKTRSLEDILLTNPSFLALHRAVERCVQEGIFHVPQDSRLFLMSMTFWEILHGGAMLAIANHMERDLAQRGETAVSVLARGYQCKAGV